MYCLRIPIVVFIFSQIAVVRLATGVSSDSCKIDFHALWYAAEGSERALAVARRVDDLARLQLREIQNKNLPASARAALKDGFEAKLNTLVVESGISETELRNRILLAKRAQVFGRRAVGRTSERRAELHREQTQLPKLPPIFSVKWALGADTRFRSLAIDREGRYLAVGSGDQKVRIWDLDPNGKPVGEPRVRSLTGFEVNALALNPRGDLMVAGVGPTVRTLDMAISATMPGEWIRGRRDFGTVGAVAFSPDGESIADASLGGGITVTRLSGSSQRLISDKEDSFAVAYSPDGNYLAGSKEGGEIRIWKHSSGHYKLVNPLNAHSRRVLSLAFSPDGKYLASAGSTGDNRARLWDVDENQISASHILEGHDNGLTSVAFSPDSKLVATASRDSTIRIWSAASGAHLQMLAEHKGPVYAVAFGPTGKYLVSCSSDKSIKIWGANEDER